MKNILFIIPNLSSGGAEKVLIDLLKNLDYNRYKVDLLLNYKIGNLLCNLPENVSLHFIHKSHTIYDRIIKKILIIFHLNKVYYNLYSIPKIKKILGFKKYDTIVSFLEGSSLYFHSKLLNYGNKHVTWIHCDLYKYHWTLDACSITYKEEEKMYNLMDTIVNVSEKTKDSLNKLYRIKSEQIVLYNPIDKINIIKKSEELNIHKSNITICTIGRLVPVKGYELLIDVIKELIDNKYKIELWIIGEGILYDKLKFKCKTLNLEDNIKFLGFKENPYPYLKVSDIYVSASESEAYPLTICEAICLGKAIVSTRTAGSIEILENGKYGLLTDHTVESIFKAIKYLLDNPSKLEEYKNYSIIKSRELNGINSYMNEIDKIL